MFRKEALESRKQTWCGNAVLLPGVPVWLVMAMSLFFLTCLMAVIISGSYTRRINVQGEISTWPRPVNVYSGVQGFVVKQFIKEGDSIRKGEAVYQSIKHVFSYLLTEQCLQLGLPNPFEKTTGSVNFRSYESAGEGLQLLC